MIFELESSVSALFYSMNGPGCSYHVKRSHGKNKMASALIIRQRVEQHSIQRTPAGNLLVRKTLRTQSHETLIRRALL